MSWFNRSKRYESALCKVSKKILEMSLQCAETLRPDLEEKFGKKNGEFRSKYFQVVFEFMYFFLHLTDRVSFNHLGREKRDRLMDGLVPSTVYLAVESYFGNCPQHLKDGTKSESYGNYNVAQKGYGSCNEILLDPKDDTRTLDKIESGAKSKSVVGQLVDNLSRIIVGEINTNALFVVQIWDPVIEILRSKEIERLIPEVSKEIK